VPPEVPDSERPYSPTDPSQTYTAQDLCSHSTPRIQTQNIDDNNPIRSIQLRTTDNNPPIPTYADASTYPNHPINGPFHGFPSKANYNNKLQITNGVEIGKKTFTIAK
jgi:hypothetical protein